MRHRRTGTVIGVMAALVALTPVGADAKPPPTANLQSVETGCSEIAYVRGGLLDKVRPLVPERFTLVDFITPPGAPARVELRINEYVCTTVTTTAGGRQRTQRDVAGIIVSANTGTVDGQPSDGFYVLNWATENRAVNDRLNQLGWPSDLLERSSGARTSTSPGGLTEIDLTFAGSGWDHSLRGATNLPFPPASPTTGSFYRDTPAGHLQMCYANDASAVTGVVTGDLTTTPFQSVAAAPSLMAGFAGPTATLDSPAVNPEQRTTLAKGGWTATLTDGACPAPVSGTS